jgi:hypothetical protein
MDVPQSFDESATPIDHGPIAAGSGWVLVPKCAMTPQEHDQWCWASVCQSVHRTHELEVSQCEIARDVLGGAICNQQCDDEVCNHFARLSSALDRRGLLANKIDDQVDFQTVKSEINPTASRVICCPIDRGSIGHAIVICGFHDKTQRIAIFDPLLDSGPHAHDFAKFQQEYAEGGTWTITCLTQ